MNVQIFFSSILQHLVSIFILSIIHISSPLLGQRADLVVTEAGYFPSMVSRGSDLNIQLKIRNIGNANAGQSYMFFYLSKDSVINDAEVLGRVSVKSLSINETVTLEIDYPVPNNLSSGLYYVYLQLDVANQVNESEEKNIFYLQNRINVNSAQISRIRIPYPIIFIHGLAGNDDTWNELSTELRNVQRLTFGGRMDFCLNTNNDHINANIVSDYKDFTNLSSLSIADFYTVNFAVNSNGGKYLDIRDPNQSNQAAIYKQGVAIRDAVKHVLQLTNREKVILVGHSMGGLAAREYLQNPSNYQTDGKHYVAKLLTIGTPHGGSNFTGVGIGSIMGFDELSEAVRDLRTTYFTGFQGAYLFGGLESQNRIRGEVLNFKNVDVNCNGTIGDNIIGLNQKTIPEDIEYSCIIGTGSALGGDGVVSEYSANINNFKQIFADTFRIVQSSFDVTLHHLNLHKNSQNVMKGLDEADDAEVAYNIDLNQLYQGFSNAQSIFGYSFDFDMYKFELYQSGNVILKVSNIPVADFEITIFNEWGGIVASSTSNGKGNLSLSRQLPSGTYYIEFKSLWTGLSYKYPYTFRLEGDQQVNIEELDIENINCFISPNPMDENASLIFDLFRSEEVKITIVDMTGKILLQKKHSSIAGRNAIEIDASNYSAGIYVCTIFGVDFTKSIKFVVVK